MAASTAQLRTSFLAQEKVGRLSQQGVAPVSVKASLPVARAEASAEAPASLSRRDLSLSLAAAAAFLAVTPLPALADFEETYSAETKEVIDKVRYTLNLPKDDPARSEAVGELRVLSNGWVAKYRREKTVSGRPSFSNMYSVLNAISGHYISFGPTYPIPKKRQDRIFEEVDIAEKALARGR